VAFSLVAGLIFLKFWFETRDRLFVLFAIAFWALALNRAALVVVPYITTQASEHSILNYSVRLMAFILILIAIIDKSRRGSDEASLRPEFSSGPDHERPQT
jgi:hypothetical protein